MGASRQDWKVDQVTRSAKRMVFTFLLCRKQLSLEENDERVSERVAGLMIGFAEILLRLVKQEDGWMASQPVDLLVDKSFKMKNFKWYIKILAGCEEITTRNTSEFTKNDKLRNVLLESGIV